MVASEVASVLGLVGLAFIPDLCADPFAGIITCVIVYAIGSGLIEVLCSPIVEACPFDHKEAVMSLLHSFYCWGSVGVILLSSVFFTVFGIGSWRILACVWALIPLYNIFNFATCPIERLTEEGEGMTIGSLLRTPFFWIAILLMVCVSCFTPAPSKEQVDAITFSADFKKSIKESWGAFDIIGTLVVIGLCACFYAYFW